MNESLVEIGQFAEATSVAEEAMRIAEEADHPLSVAIALGGVARVSIFSGRFDKAIVILERAIELGRRWDLTRGFPETAASLAQAYFLAGRFADAMYLLDEVVRHERLRAFEVRLLGEAYLLADQRETALDYARRALVLSQECKERGSEAWALRLLGEITFDSDARGADAAESYYSQSLSLAEELGMRPLVSHCHLDLGILYQQTERSLEAQEHLSTGTALFDEMGMRLPFRAENWLKQGRTLQS
jgi:tetratricopeptide (TPR) repeat protein